MKYAVDCVGGKIGTEVIKSLGIRGTMLVYGALSHEPYVVDIGPILLIKVWYCCFVVQAGSLMEYS